jgi:isopenicillin-N epimerase
MELNGQTALVTGGADGIGAGIAEQLAAEVSTAAWNGRGWLRLCGQVYNTPDEYDRLAARLPALLARG